LLCLCCQVVRRRRGDVHGDLTAVVLQLGEAARATAAGPPVALTRMGAAVRAEAARRRTDARWALLRMHFLAYRRASRAHTLAQWHQVRRRACRQELWLLAGAPVGCFDKQLSGPESSASLPCCKCGSHKHIAFWLAFSQCWNGHGVTAPLLPSAGARREPGGLRCRLLRMRSLARTRMRSAVRRLRQQMRPPPHQAQTRALRARRRLHRMPQLGLPPQPATSASLALSLTRGRARRRGGGRRRRRCWCGRMRRATCCRPRGGTLRPRARPAWDVRGLRQRTSRCTWWPVMWCTRARRACARADRARLRETIAELRGAGTSWYRAARVGSSPAAHATFADFGLHACAGGVSGMWFC